MRGCLVGLLFRWVVMGHRAGLCILFIIFGGSATKETDCRRGTANKIAEQLTEEKEYDAHDSDEATKSGDFWIKIMGTKVNKRLKNRNLLAEVILE